MKISFIKNLGWIFLSILLSFILITLFRYSIYELFPNYISKTQSIIVIFFLFLSISFIQKTKYLLYGPACLSIFILIIQIDAKDYFSVDFIIIFLSALTAYGFKKKKLILIITSIIFSSLLIYWYNKKVTTPIYNDYKQKNTSSVNLDYTSLIKKSKLSTHFFKDTVYLLNFTQTFCLPCKEKKPSLEIVATKLKNKPFKLVNIYFSQDETFKIETTPNTVTFYDKKDLFSKKMKINGAPTEIILDKNGKIRRTMLGYTKELNSNYESDTELLLKKLINEK